MDRLKALSMATYLAMGWLIIVAARPYLTRTDPPRPAGTHARVGRYAWHDHYGPLRAGLREVARALNDIGYDGPLSVEWEDCGMQREFGAQEPGRTDLRRDLSVSLNNLGRLAEAAGRGDEARR